MIYFTILYCNEVKIIGLKESQYWDKFDYQMLTGNEFSDLESAMREQKNICRAFGVAAVAANDLIGMED